MTPPASPTTGEVYCPECQMACVLMGDMTSGCCARPVLTERPKRWDEKDTALAAARQEIEGLKAEVERLRTVPYSKLLWNYVMLREAVSQEETEHEKVVEVARETRRERDAARAALTDRDRVLLVLLDGIRAWGNDEDGIPDWLAPAYEAGRQRLAALATPPG